MKFALIVFWFVFGLVLSAGVAFLYAKWDMHRRNKQLRAADPGLYAQRPPSEDQLYRGPHAASVFVVSLVAYVAFTIWLGM